MWVKLCGELDVAHFAGSVEGAEASRRMHSFVADVACARLTYCELASAPPLSTATSKTSAAGN